MDFDLIFVAGCLILLFAIPAVVSAFSDGRVPRFAAVIITIGGILLYFAIVERPGTYTLETLPDVFVRVVARFIN